MSRSASDIINHLDDSNSDAGIVTNPTRGLDSSFSSDHGILSSELDTLLLSYDQHYPQSLSGLYDYNTQMNSSIVTGSTQKHPFSPLTSQLEELKDPSNSKLSMLSLSKLTNIQKQLDENKHLTGAPTAIASNTRFILIGTSKGFVWVFDHFQSRHGVFGTQTQHRQDTLQRGSVQAIDISPDGETCVIAHRSGHVVVWDVLPKTILKVVDDFHLKDNPNAPTIIQIALLNRGKLQFLILNSNGGVCLTTLSKTLIVWSCSVQWLFNSAERPAIHFSVLPPLGSISGSDRKQQPQQLSGSSSHDPSDPSAKHITEQYALIAVSFEDRTLIVSLEPQIKVVSGITRDVTVRAGVFSSTSWRMAPPKGTTPTTLGVIAKQTPGTASSAQSTHTDPSLANADPTTTSHTTTQPDSSTADDPSSPTKPIQDPDSVIPQPTSTIHGSRDMTFYYRNAVVSLARGTSLQLFSAFDSNPEAAAGGGSSSGISSSTSSLSTTQLSQAPSMGVFGRTPSTTATSTSQQQQQKPSAGGGGAAPKPSFPVSLEKIATLTFATDILTSKWLNDSTFLVFTSIPSSSAASSQYRYCVYVIDLMGLNLVEILPIGDIICPLTVFNNIVSRRPDKSYVTSFSSTYGNNSSALFVVLDITTQQIAIGQVKLMSFIERINAMADVDWVRALSVAFTAWKRSRDAIVSTIHQSFAGGSSLSISSTGQNRMNTGNDDGDDDSDDGDDATPIIPVLSSESISCPSTASSPLQPPHKYSMFNIPSPPLCSLDEFITIKQRMALVASQQDVSTMSNSVLSDRIIDILLNHVDNQLKLYANVGVPLTDNEVSHIGGDGGGGRTIDASHHRSTSIDDLATLDGGSPSVSGSGSVSILASSSPSLSSPQQPILSERDITQKKDEIIYTTASTAIDLCIRLQRLDILFKLVAPRFYKYGIATTIPFIDLLLKYFIYYHIPLIDEMAFDAIMTYTYHSLQFHQFLTQSYEMLGPLLFPSLDSMVFGIPANPFGGVDATSSSSSTPGFLAVYEHYTQQSRLLQEWLNEHKAIVKPIQLKLNTQLTYLRTIFRHIHPFYLLALSFSTPSSSSSSVLSSRAIPSSFYPNNLFSLFSLSSGFDTQTNNIIQVTYPNYSHHHALLDAMLNAKDCYATKTGSQQLSTPSSTSSTSSSSSPDGINSPLALMLSAVSSTKNQQCLLPISFLTTLFGQHIPGSIDLAYILSAVLSLSLVDSFLHLSYASLHINKILHQLLVHFNVYPQLVSTYQAIPPPVTEPITSQARLPPIATPHAEGLIPYIDDGNGEPSRSQSTYYTSIGYLPSPITASPASAHTYAIPTAATSYLINSSGKPNVLIQTALRHANQSTTLQTQEDPVSSLFSFIQQTERINHNYLISLLYHYVESILSISTTMYEEKPLLMDDGNDSSLLTPHPIHPRSSTNNTSTFTSPVTSSILPSNPTSVTDANANSANRYFGGSVLDNVNIAYTIPNLHQVHYQFAESNVLWTLMMSKTHPFWTQPVTSPTTNTLATSFTNDKGIGRSFPQPPRKIYHQQFVNCEITTITLYRAQLMSLLFTPEFIDFTTPASNYFTVAQQQQLNSQSRHRRRRSSISNFFRSSTPPPPAPESLAPSSHSIAIPQSRPSTPVGGHDGGEIPNESFTGNDRDRSCSNVLVPHCSYPYLLPFLANSTAFFSILLNLFVTPDWLLFESTTYPFVSQMTSTSPTPQVTSSSMLFGSSVGAPTTVPMGTSPSQAQVILTRSSSQVRPGTPSSIPKSFIPALSQAQHHSPHRQGLLQTGSSPSFVSELQADVGAGFNSLKNFLGYSTDTSKPAKPSIAPPSQQQQQQQQQSLVQPGSFQRTFSFSQKETNLIPPSSSKLSSSHVHGSNQLVHSTSGLGTAGGPMGGRGSQTATYPSPSGNPANNNFSAHHYRTIYTSLFPSPIPSVVNIIEAIHSSLTQHQYPNIYKTAFDFATKVDITSPSSSTTTLSLLRDKIYSTSAFDHYVLLLSFVHYCLQVDLLSIDELPPTLIPVLCAYACLAPDHHVMSIYYLSALSIAAKEKRSTLPLPSTSCHVLVQPFSVEETALVTIFSQPLTVRPSQPTESRELRGINRKLSTHRELLLLSLIPYLDHYDAIVYLAENALFSRALLSIYIEQRNFDKVLTSFISNVDELVNDARIAAASPTEASTLSLTRTPSSTDQQQQQQQQQQTDQLPWGGFLFDETTSLIDDYSINPEYDVNHVLLSTLPESQREAIARRQESRQVLTHLSVDLFSYIAYELCNALGTPSEFEKKAQSVLSHLPHLTQVCPLGVIALTITLLSVDEKHSRQVMEIFSDSRAVLFQYLSLLFKAYDYSQTLTPPPQPPTAPSPLTSSVVDPSLSSTSPETRTRSGLGLALNARQQQQGDLLNPQRIELSASGTTPSDVITNTSPSPQSPSNDISSCYVIFQKQLNISAVGQVMSTYRYTPPAHFKNMYLELMCEFSPHKVYHYLSTNSNYDIEAMLALCRRFKIHDATAYILERTGDLHGALDLLLQAVRKDAESFQSIVHQHLDHYRPVILQAISVQHENFMKTCPPVEDELDQQLPSSSSPPSSSSQLKKTKSKTKIRGQGGSKTKQSQKPGDDVQSPSSPDGSSASTSTPAQSTVTPPIDGKSTSAPARGISSTVLYPAMVQKLLPQHRRLLAHSISTCISLCQRTSEQQTADGQQLWFMVVELLVKIERSIRQAREQSASTELILHPPLKSIIQYQKTQQQKLLIPKEQLSQDTKQQQEQGQQQQFYHNAIAMLNSSTIPNAYLDALSNHDIVLLLLHSVIITHLFKSIQQAIEFLRIEVVVKRLISLYEHDTLGTFRDVFMLLLESQTYELSILRSTSDLIVNDKALSGKLLLFHQKKCVNYSSSLSRLFTTSDQYIAINNKARVSSGLPPLRKPQGASSTPATLATRTMVCDMCETQVTSTTSIYLYGCGHILHVACASDPPAASSRPGAPRQNGPITVDQSPCVKCRTGGGGSMGMSNGVNSLNSSSHNGGGGGGTASSAATSLAPPSGGFDSSMLFLANQQRSVLRLMSYEQFANISRSYEELSEKDDAQSYAYLDDKCLTALPQDTPS